jgi:hypothetical protein
VPFTPSSQTIGQSFFGLLDDNTNEIQCYLRYLGIANLKATRLSDEDIVALNDKKYPVFPAKGSVFYHKGVLVVKLEKITHENFHLLRAHARLFKKDAL